MVDTGTAREPSIYEWSLTLCSVWNWSLTDPVLFQILLKISFHPAQVADHLSNTKMGLYNNNNSNNSNSNNNNRCITFYPLVVLSWSTPVTITLHHSQNRHRHRLTYRGVQWSTHCPLPRPDPPQCWCHKYNKLLPQCRRFLVRQCQSLHPSRLNPPPSQTLFSGEYCPPSTVKTRYLTQFNKLVTRLRVYWFIQY